MTTQKYHFQKLTPKDDVGLGIYEDALEYAFSNSDICNVAISGAYGAGKSSVVETYKKKHPEKRFLHISLAHFADETHSTVDDQEITVTELEGKIINQLVHQIPPDRIPQTNFTMKKKTDENRLEKNTVLIMVFVLLCCFLGFHEAWCGIVDGLSWDLLRSLLAFTTAKEMVLLCGIVCIVMLAFACYELMKRQMNRSILRKFNIKGNNFDIELFDGEADSYFDKYLNEVLYLFESVEADAIVFEDMDRYDINLIFEKLREINTLLNRRISMLSERKDGPIRFIYQLRDDMFVTKDRTKFFDLIIPVVPVVDGSNSLDMFLAYFDESGITGLFDRDFLQGLSLYVDDMRILKNICNEFLIYHAKLQESFVGQNDNKLLAMIVYKNIFPRDFGELQVSQGYVYHLFQGKDKFIADETEAIRLMLGMLEEEEANSAAELSKSIDELDAIYFTDYRPMKVNDKTVDQFGNRAEFVAAIKENGYVVSVGKPYYYSSDYNWANANVKDKFDALTSNPEYVERKKTIENRMASRKNKRQLKLREYRNKLDNLQTAFLKDVITKDNADKIFEAPRQEKVNGVENFDSIKKNPYFPLIKYLIRNGYIDETYHDYMTFFYENSISRQDKIFLLSITDQKAKEYDYVLQNARLVIDRMRMRDFEAEECRNYDLLDALLVYSEQYREQLKHFLHSLWNWEPAEFVDGYIMRGQNIREFSEKFNKVWHRACVWIIQEEKISEDAKRRYVLETLCEADEALLEECNKNGELTGYINAKEDFLDISFPFSGDLRMCEYDADDISAIFAGLIKLNVKFVNIDVAEADKALLQKVYDSNMYVLSEKMIALFLEHMYHIPVSEEYQTKNLSLILSQNQPLAKYVKANMEAYIRMRIDVGNRMRTDAAGRNGVGLENDVEGMESERFSESTDALLCVLNDESLDKQYKIEFSKLLSTKLTKLSDVQDKELWKDVLANNVIDSMENLCDYFYLSENAMDEELADYINRYEGNLTLEESALDEQYGEGAADKLFWALVKANDLDNDKYCSLLNSFDWQINKISATDIDKEKVEVLIRENILAMSTANLQFLRDNYEDLVYKFIDSDVETYIEIVEPDELRPEEVAHVLELNIGDLLKIQLLEKDEGPISVKGKNYSDALTAHILRNNLDEGEKSQLYNWYPKGMPLVRGEILRIAKEDVEEIISSGESIHRELLDVLLRDESISSDNKKYLLANKLHHLKTDVVQEYLRFLQWSDFESLFDGKRPTFEGTSANEALLTAFQKRGWLTKFEPDKENSSLYRAIGRKPKEIKIS